MKKTIVLLTIVLAILAAPVFAEVTTSGDVEFDWAFGADDNYKDGETDGSAKIALDGAISDFTSISAAFEADYDDSASLNAMTLTQDITGILGVDGAVAFSYTVGFMGYSPVTYSEVAPYTAGIFDAEAGKKVGVDGNFGSSTYTVGEDYYSASSMLGFKMMFGLADMVNVDVALYPSSMMSKESRGYYGAADSALEMGINAYGTFGMVDASVYYVASTRTNLLEDDGDDADSNGNMFGFSAASTVMEGLKVGAGLEMNMDQDIIDVTGAKVGEVGMSVTDVSVDAAYTMDALTAGLSFYTAFASEDTGLDFAEVSGIGISAKYAVTEMANLTAALTTPFSPIDPLEFADVMGYEVGADVTLDGVTYMAGYTLMSDYSAYDAEFLNKKGEATGDVYLKIKASF
ncbi:hypothetical protein [Oceanispirochaeta sp.]|jgi:hypothetical protein|uniref:hypothetical protein n=1 Tax=Oceanispirochaeta sp. TaxID=2035350 RepID=UPI00260F55C6|nr:hypothetical protein [Oceanispirochaeta sp.]MDA3955196.1 hypothetical protein [Oceanispirochaeta sp.]